MPKVHKSAFSIGQHDQIDCNSVVLRKITAADLNFIKALFGDPSFMQYMDTAPTRDSDWATGGKMYDRFQAWVKRAYNREPSWWTVYSKPSFEAIGAIGLKLKADNTLEVAVLMSHEQGGDKIAAEALSYLFWWHNHNDPMTETCRVLIKLRLDNVPGQRLATGFGLQSDKTLHYLPSDPRPRYLYTALLKDIFTSRTTEAAQANTVQVKKTNSSAPYKTQSSTSANMSPVVTFAQGDGRHHTTHLSNSLLVVNYNQFWQSKRISSNAKKVEFFTGQSQNPDLLPCIDTNQLTSIASVTINPTLQSDSLTVCVRIYSAADNTLVLQANKSKRKKTSRQTNEKLEFSSFVPELDGSTEIRLQASNVMKEGGKRIKCFACIQLRQGSQILDQVDTIMFYIIAKLNYKNYDKNHKKSKVSTVITEDNSSVASKQDKTTTKTVKEESPESMAPSNPKEQRFFDSINSIVASYSALQQQVNSTPFMPFNSNSHYVQNDFLSQPCLPMPQPPQSNFGSPSLSMMNTFLEAPPSSQQQMCMNTLPWYDFYANPMLAFETSTYSQPPAQSPPASSKLIEDVPVPQFGSDLSETCDSASFYVDKTFSLFDDLETTKCASPGVTLDCFL